MDGRPLCVVSVFGLGSHVLRKPVVTSCGALKSIWIGFTPSIKAARITHHHMAAPNSQHDGRPWVAVYAPPSEIDQRLIHLLYYPTHIHRAALVLLSLTLQSKMADGKKWDLRIVCMGAGACVHVCMG